MKSPGVISSVYIDVYKRHSVHRAQVELFDLTGAYAFVHLAQRRGVFCRYDDTAGVAVYALSLIHICNSVPTPRAAAVLMTVPRLPGSRSDSNAMILPPRKTASHDAAVLSIVAILRILSIYFATVIIPSGDFSSLILSKAASESI